VANKTTRCSIVGEPRGPLRGEESKPDGVKIQNY
jgi:hypothetical protein